MKWNLNEIYQSQTEWLEDLTNFENAYKTIEIDGSDVGRTINYLEEAYARLDTIYTFALLNYFQNTKSKETFENLTLASSTFDDFNSKTSYLQEKLMKDKNLINELNNNSSIKIYKKYYEQLQEDSSSNIIYSQVHEALLLDEQLDKILEFEDNILFYVEYQNKNIAITHENLVKNLNHPNREVRKKIFINLENKINTISNEAAIIYSTHFKLLNLKATSNQDLITSFELSMQDNPLNITPSEYFDLKHKIKELFTTILDFKRKRLNLERISFYDLYYLKDATHISFEKGKEIAIDLFSSFGDSYKNIVNRVFYENWILIDKENNQKSGARSISCLKTHPYIMLNWNNDLESLYALVHEIGGAIGQYFASQAPSFIYSELSIFKTELLSSLSELSLSKYLLINNFNGSYIDKIIDIIKDSVIITYEETLVEQEFSKVCMNGIPTSEDFSAIYEGIINDFHDYEFFDSIEENRFNWIRFTSLIDDGYNFKYIASFLVAFKLFEDINKQFISWENIAEILKYGEYYSDKQFVKELGLNIDIQNLLISLESTMEFLIKQLSF